MGMIYSAVVSNEPLAAATGECLIMLTGASAVRGRIIEYGVAFDGISSIAEPVDVSLRRFTSAGTASKLTASKWDTVQPARSGSVGSPEVEIFATGTFTSQPSLGSPADVLHQTMVHPQGVPFAWAFPLGREPVIDDAVERIGLYVVSAAIVNASAWITWEE